MLAYDNAAVAPRYHRLDGRLAGAQCGRVVARRGRDAPASAPHPIFLRDVPASTSAIATVMTPRQSSISINRARRRARCCEQRFELVMQGQCRGQRCGLHAGMIAADFTPGIKCRVVHNQPAVVSWSDRQEVRRQATANLASCSGTACHHQVCQSHASRHDADVNNCASSPQ